MLKQRQQQLKNMSVYMDSLSQNKSYEVQNQAQKGQMSTRIEEIGALVRKIIIEIQ